MDNEFLDLRNCLERMTEGAVFSEDYSDAEEEVRDVIIGSLYMHWIRYDLQGIIKKYLKAYIFRESLRNKKNVMFIVADEIGNKFYSHIPAGFCLCGCEIDFIEREKLGEYERLTGG